MSPRQRHTLLSTLDVVGSLLEGQQGTGRVSRSLRARHVLAARGAAGSRRRPSQSEGRLPWPRRPLAEALFPRTFVSAPLPIRKLERWPSHRHQNRRAESTGFPFSEGVPGNSDPTRHRSCRACWPSRDVRPAWRMEGCEHALGRGIFLLSFSNASDHGTPFGKQLFASGILWSTV